MLSKKFPAPFVNENWHPRILGAVIKSHCMVMVMVIFTIMLTVWPTSLSMTIQFQVLSQVSHHFLILHSYLALCFDWVSTHNLLLAHCCCCFWLPTQLSTQPLIVHNWNMYNNHPESLYHLICILWHGSRADCFWEAAWSGQKSLVQPMHLFFSEHLVLLLRSQNSGLLVVEF